MTHKRSRGRPPADLGDTEKPIRIAALRRFATAGFDATSLRDIAADAQVDLALISYKFGSKLGLWKSVVEHVGRAIVERLQDLTHDNRDADPGVRLAAAMRAFIDINCDHEAVPRFLLRDAEHDEARSQWVFDHVSRPGFDCFAPLIERAHAAGKVTAPIARLFFMTFAYGVAVSVVRRDKIAAFAPQLRDDAAFRQALSATLVEPHFRHG